MCLCKCFCLDTFSLFPMIPMILEWGHQRLIVFRTFWNHQSGFGWKWAIPNSSRLEVEVYPMKIDETPWFWRCFGDWDLLKQQDVDGERCDVTIWMEGQPKKDRTTRVVVRCNSGNISLPMGSLGHWSETWSSEAPRLIRTIVSKSFRFSIHGGWRFQLIHLKKVRAPPLSSKWAYKPHELARYIPHKPNR